MDSASRSSFGMTRSFFGM